MSPAVELICPLKTPSEAFKRPVLGFRENLILLFISLPTTPSV
jgi:hypothetical protein